MRRARGQQGAALIMIIGVVAALAVLASTLVLLTVNAAGNTGRDRGRAQAFNVTEGLIDYSLSQLGKKWPVSAAPTIDKAAFVAQFNTGAAAGNFTISNPNVTIFDNVETAHSGVINRDNGVPYDSNGDGLIYLEAQATVNQQTARIQVEVRQSMLDAHIPHGIPVATNGNVQDPNSGSMNGNYAIGCDSSSGGAMGDQTSLGILAGGNDIDGPATYGPAVLYGPDLDNNGVPDGVKTGVTGAANTVVTPAILQSIITSAKMTGTWYSDIATEQAAGAKPMPNQFDTVAEGVVVVETTNSVKITSNSDLNGDGMNGNKKPGFLVVIGPATMYPGDASKTGKSAGVDIAGTATYYGLVYTDGPVDFTGTMMVAGMVVAEGDVNLNGARCIQYNDKVITNLNNAVPVMAQIVPNTWRQIQPL